MSRYLLILKAIQNLVVRQRKMKSARVKSNLRARAESCHFALLGMEAISTKTASSKVDLSVTVVMSCLFSWTSEEITTSRAVPLAGILKTVWIWSKRTFCFLQSSEIKSLDEEMGKRLDLTLSHAKWRGGKMCSPIPGLTTGSRGSLLHALMLHSLSWSQGLLSGELC